MTSVLLDGELRDGRHTFIVRVYYEDTDFTGIVYHANYLRYMERGRTNYLRLIGADHRVLFEQTEEEAPGFAFVVRSMTLDFLKPAEIAELVESVQRVGIKAAIGGSLKPEHLKQLKGIAPDWFAVRASACAAGKRDGTIDPARVKKWKEAIS